MLSEEFFSAVSGPPLAPNTSVSKDIGIYHHALKPSYAVRGSFKKSSAAGNGMAVGDTHLFVAQADKAHVHVYSRLRGNLEALVAFPDRLRCLALQGDVLLVGTTEGRLILWEICTGRQVTTPQCHVQPITCIAATPHHVLTGSDDGNIHVWSLPRLLEMGRGTEEHEPERTLASHRGGVTAIVVGPSLNPETAVCVTASRDRTCVIWNYHSAEALRTLVFAAAPLCLALDPAGRAVFVGCEDAAIYLVELFGPGAPLGGGGSGGSGGGGRGDEVLPVHVKTPLGVADADAGPATCLAVSYDGTALVSGHPRGKLLQWTLSGSRHAIELADLNAAVTNVAFVPLFPRPATTRPLTVVKPTQAGREYTFTAQLEGHLDDDEDDASSGHKIGRAQRGFSRQVLEAAVAAMAQPPTRGGGGSGRLSTDEEARREREELWDIIREQRELQRITFQKYTEAKARK